MNLFPPQSPLAVSADAVCFILEAIADKIRRSRRVTPKDWDRLRKQIEDTERAVNRP